MTDVKALNAGVRIFVWFLVCVGLALGTSVNVMKVFLKASVCFLAITALVSTFFCYQHSRKCC